MRCLALICAILLSFPAYAVERDSSIVEHRIGVNVRPGILSQHNRFLRGDNVYGRPMKATGSVHLQYSFKFPSGSLPDRVCSSSWQGIGVAAYTFGNHEEVGSPVALYVFQGARIVSLGEKFSLDYEWNFGVSMGWHTSNMFIGTKVNAYMNTGFFLSWYPARDWTVSAGIDMSHFSNGDTTFPNSGINSLALRLGMVRSFNGRGFVGMNQKHYGPDMSGKRFTDWMTVDVLAYGAWNVEAVNYQDTEILVNGRFAVAGMHVNPLYNILPWLGVGASLDLQYNEGMNIQNHIAGYGTDGFKFFRPSFMERFGVGLSLRAELQMPVFAVNAGVGHNVIYKGEELGGIYGLLSLKTFMTRNLFLNVGLKVCTTECSNNLLLGVGWRFRAGRVTK